MNIPQQCVCTDAYFAVKIFNTQIPCKQLHACISDGNERAQISMFKSNILVSAAVMLLTMAHQNEFNGSL